MCHELAFVIRGSAGKDDTIFNPWLEWGRGPQIKRIHRLHIIVSINQHRGTPGAVYVFGNHHRMPRRGMDFRRQACITALRCQPVRTRPDIARMGAIGRNAGKTEEIEKEIEWF
jgi:hypothetical protein